MTPSCGGLSTDPPIVNNGPNNDYCDDCTFTNP
jgi:hypothetical protein